MKGDRLASLRLTAPQTDQDSKWPRSEPKPADLHHLDYPPSHTGRVPFFELWPRLAAVWLGDSPSGEGQLALAPALAASSPGLSGEPPYPALIIQ